MRRENVGEPSRALCEFRVRRPFSAQGEIERKRSQNIFLVFDLKYERGAKFFSLQNEKR
jgi:hypothetical protein